MCSGGPRKGFEVRQLLGRLSRLTEQDWRKLRAEIDAEQVRVVALDLPTSRQMTSTGDEFTRRMFAAINSMLLGMLAAVARKDYEDRRSGKRRGSRRRSERASIWAGLRTRRGMRGSQVCSRLGCRGQRYRTRRSAAGRRLRKSRGRGFTHPLSELRLVFVHKQQAVDFVGGIVVFVCARPGGFG